MTCVRPCLCRAAGSGGEVLCLLNVDDRDPLFAVAPDGELAPASKSIPLLFLFSGWEVCFPKQLGPAHASGVSHGIGAAGDLASTGGALLMLTVMALGDNQVLTCCAVQACAARLAQRVRGRAAGARWAPFRARCTTKPPSPTRDCAGAATTMNEP